MKTDFLQSAYSDGSLSPRRLIADIRERIAAADNPAIWIHLLDDAELEPYLNRLDDTALSELPLYGIPFAIKDNIDLAGVPTTAGCPAYAYTPERSATVVEKLIRAGAIPVGKTNLDQFATGLVGTRSPYGVPRNPRAPDRVPGGSSSGSAVALAEGFVSFALGTDTAGSGRVPAVFNGLWGLKPSRGRLSTRGVVPACRTLDCVSIFALNAVDARRVLDVAEGYDAADPFSHPLRNEDPPSTGRIGIPQPDQLMFFGDAGYEAAWQNATKDLVRRGWQIEPIDFGPFLEAARLLYEGPWVAERFAAVEDFLATNAEEFYPTTRDIIAGGAKASARDAFVATYRLAELRRASESVWAGIDAIVTPTTGGFPSLAELEADPVGPNSRLGYYTNFMNLLDLCAVAAPAGQTTGGLPFGITWIAPRDRDRPLLEAASRSDLSRLGPASRTRLKSVPPKDTLTILLFGAHMRGLPLNAQVEALGATFLAEVQTAPKYKMIHLPEPAPPRPGIVRVENGGRSINAEAWAFPKAGLGEFLATIHQPLGLGEIELDDGSRAHGFLCEATAAEAAEDISEHGGWRAFIDR